MFYSSVSPESAAARFALGQLSSDAILRLADSWLSGGCYSESLGELFFISNPTLVEVTPIWERALSELGVKSMTRREAAEYLIHETLTGIVSGQVDPVDGAEFLYLNVHHELDEELPDRHYLGDALGLAHLFAWLREIWDCRDGSMILHYTDLPRADAELKLIEHIVTVSSAILKNET